MSANGVKRRCNKCTNTIERDELKVVCAGLCMKYFHASCVKIDKNQHESLKQNSSLCFRCDACSDRDNGMMEMIRCIKMTMTKLESYQKKYHGELSVRLDKVESTLESSGKNVIEGIKKVDNEIKKVDESLNDGKWITVNNKKKNAKPNLRKATVIITPNGNEKSRNDLRRSIKEKIEGSDFDVMCLTNAPANGISIVCENEAKCDSLIKEIEAKLDENVTVSKPKNFNPRIKLVKVHDANEDDNKFVEILKAKNSHLQNAELKIIKREVVRINGKVIENLSNIIIEVNPFIHNEIMKTKRIKHIWEIVRVVDNIYIRRCYNCMGYNHNAADCKNMKACGSCAGEHSSKECSNIKKGCVNCIKANERMSAYGNSKLVLDINHSAWSNDCSIYKRKLEHSKKAINTID